jgi:hypothetical protein
MSLRQPRRGISSHRIVRNVERAGGKAAPTPESPLRPRAIGVSGGFDELPRIRGVDTVEQLSHNRTALTNQNNAPVEGSTRMRGITAMVVFLFGAALFVGWGREACLENNGRCRSISTPGKSSP